MRVSRVSKAFAIAALVCTCGWGQRPEYDFYREFRNVFVPQLRFQDRSISEDGIAERYAAKLRTEGMDETEISRRLRLIRSDRKLLESQRSGTQTDNVSSPRQ